MSPGDRSLGKSERRLVAVLGVTFLLNQYDMALLGLALPQIQLELAISETMTGPFVGFVRLGAIAALAFTVAADGRGRSRLLLFTIAGFAVATTASAFARTAGEFAALQFFARACIAAEEVIAIVLVAEQLPARARGTGLGLLAIFGALGHGVAALAYGFVESLPFGWRALYVVGAVPLPALLYLRRNLQESRRFEELRAVEPATTSAAVLRRLFTESGARLYALLAAISAFGAASATALSFVSKTLQSVHGYSPGQVTALVIGGGAVALLVYPIGGALSDRCGRRPILVGALVLHLAGIHAFYGGTGAAIAPAWIAMMAGFMTGDVLLGALGAELFPTDHRATASGLRMLFLAGGGAIGLFLEGFLYSGTGSHAPSILSVALALPLAVSLTFFLPETARRELDEVSPVRVRPHTSEKTIGGQT